MEGKLFDKKEFQTTYNGKKTDLYHLKSKKLHVSITNFGGIIVQLLVNHKNKWIDVCQGMPSIKAILECPEKYFGAVVGRVCNRIGNATFKVNGVTYNTPKNAGGKHTLHSNAMFSYRVWDVIESTEKSLTIQTVSEDGEEGFPGQVKATVKYEIVNENELRLILSATTDKDTPINLTSHPFFNLDGAENVYNTKCQINADRMIGLSDQCISEKIYNVKTDLNGSFDFQKERTLYPANILTEIDAKTNAQFNNGRGYDHNFVLSDAVQKYREVACFTGTNDLKMRVLTNQAGVQLYTGNWLDGSMTGKYGVSYGQRSSFCAECQNWPDAVNRKEFPNSILKPGEIYTNECGYAFE